MAYTTINKSTDYFNTKIFTGTNGSGQSITGVGFQPDMIWIKHRTDISDHVLTDAVRGVTKYTRPNATDAETTNAQAITAFGTDGFTHGTLGDIDSTGNVCSWNWKAGGGQGSSNTDGSINTTYTSVNTTAGFSISKYTGTGSAATVGHGLGAVPKLIIIKKQNSNTGADWYVYHASNGNDSKIWLNQTSAKGTGTHMNNTTPTSSVFSIGTPTEVNNSGDTYVAYCFAEKTGYSKFGKYTGNGNGDGTFVYTGFKPKFIITKRSSGSEEWNINDTTRDSYGNPLDANLLANTTAAETDYDRLDAVSNGFKMRTDSGQYNTSGNTYIYIAFGQSLVGSNNIPCTAR